jgi:hypothetical protein
MAIARALRSLQIYDILANLVPGVVVLIVIGVAVPVECYLGEVPSSILVTGVIIVGFVSGHVIQALASRLNGEPRLFGLLVAELRETEPYDPEGTLELLPDRAREWLGFKRTPVTKISITEVEKAFWPMAKAQFDLSEEFRNYGRLMQLVLSYLETVPTTRALRFQSIHSFHRSMWAVCFLSVALVSTVGISGYLNLVEIRSWPILALLGVCSALGIWIFGKRKEKFNRKVVEYTVIDFYTAQKSQ